MLLLVNGDESAALGLRHGWQVPVAEAPESSRGHFAGTLHNRHSLQPFDVALGRGPRAVPNRYPQALLGVLLLGVVARRHQRKCRLSESGDAPGTSSDAMVTWKLGAVSFLAYALIYFFRFPIFMLPDNLTSVPVGSMLGVTIPFKDALSFCFILGFALAKFPAVKVMSSELFMNNRFSMLAFLNVTAAVFGTLPLALTGSPQACLLGVFVSAFPASWVFGGFAAYLEGRQSTEVLFAALTSSFIFAGSASRGMALAVLDTGIDPAWMPAAIAAVALPLTLALLKVLDGLPPPSAEDLAARGQRGAATLEQSLKFTLRYLPGLMLFMLGYALLMTIRQFRDLFARDLLVAAFGGTVPDAATIFFLDAAGGAVAFAMLLAFSKIPNNKDAMLSMAAGAGAFTLCTILAAQAFAAGVIGALAWQVLIGICIFGGLACMQAAFFDRLVAVSGQKITCTFLIFVMDLVGYVGTLTLFSWKLLGSGGAAPAQTVLAQFTAATTGLGLAGAASLAGCWWYFRQSVQDGGGQKHTRC